MKKNILVFGVLISCSCFSLAHATWWQDAFENFQASTIQYGKTRNTEVKKYIRPSITPRSFSVEEKKPLFLYSSAPLTNSEKANKIGLGIMRERPLPKIGENYKSGEALTTRRISNLEKGASSYKQRVRDERNERTTLATMKRSYFQRKTNAFDITKYKSTSQTTK